MPDDVSDVLAANAAFYDAFERQDLSAMGAVWGEGDGIVCVHPGWPRLRGRAAVMESWAGIFRGPQRLQFILTGEQATVSGDSAWVVLDENLLDGPAAGVVAAINVFTRVDGRWRMIVHHGSPVPNRV
ncbi:MAG: nuclear transport factor 2 family protein [Actinomycetota bacterium]